MLADGSAKAILRLFISLKLLNIQKLTVKNESSSRKAKILTTGIHRVFRGLKFEPDTEIEKKRVFCKGLKLSVKFRTRRIGYDAGR